MEIHLNKPYPESKECSIIEKEDIWNYCIYFCFGCIDFEMFKMFGSIITKFKCSKLCAILLLTNGSPRIYTVWRKH